MLMPTTALAGCGTRCATTSKRFPLLLYDYSYVYMLTDESRDHKNQLHRKHRGIMQWRVAREADYLGSKLSKLGNVSRIFHHGEKETGIETEV